MSLEDINVKELTPMMKHWYAVKKKYPEHLLAYRMGDFFEFFYDDAINISKLVGITLTKRKIGSGSYPLAGIPHHSMTNYFNNLINQGQTVVIVEQLEDPATVKGRIVKRGVTRILSPGTVIDSNMLDSNKNNYIASMIKAKMGYGIAFADLSTGEFLTTEFSSKEQDPIEKLLSVVSQYDPVEIVVPIEFKKDENLFIHLTDISEAVIKTYEDYVFTYDEASNIITRHFKLSNLAGFGLDKTAMAVQAAGGLLAFLKETQRDVIPNIFKISLIQEAKILHLDYITQRNLELVNSLWEKGKDTSLFSVFNQTHTPMGARLLKKIILQPLINIDEINQRLNIVQKFKDDIFLRSDLRDQLRIIGDLERYINKVNYTARTNARDLLNIKNSLENIPKIKNLLQKADIQEISYIIKNINDFRKICHLIDISIKENAPITIKEGNIIKEGFNDQVDELRDILNNGMKYLLQYEEELKKKWNLNSGLKIGHNNVLGYYIQITHNTLKSISKIPEDFIERSTLKNAKRYTTARLKELEEKIVSAEERISDVEYEIFCTIRDKVIKETKNILETAKNIANIDVLACFAEISEKCNYCRPIVNNDSKIIIKEGRHPVIEQANPMEPFIPNDCFLDVEKEQLLIITGPNMAGKCVKGDTLLFTEYGVLPIEYFKPESINDDSFEELNLELIGLGGRVASSHFYSNGEKPSIRIETKLGYSIEGSFNHPILVRNPKGEEIWKRLEDVSIDDYMIINTKNDLWGIKTKIEYNPPNYEIKTPIYSEGVIKYKLPKKLDNDLSYLIGLLIGDGTLTYTHSINLTSKDSFIKEEFYRIIKSNFNYDAKSKKADKSEHFVSSKYIRDFFYSLGLDYIKAHQKEVPKVILMAPKIFVINFLQGLFDADGTADKRYGNVSFSTTSIKLALQVHSLLLNLGIISSLKSKETSGRTIFSVKLYGEDSQNFYDKIDFRLPRKSKRKKLLPEVHMTNIHSIPYLNGLLKTIQKRIVDKGNSIPHQDKLKYNKQIGSIFYSYIPQKRNISFKKLNDLVEYCLKYNIKCVELISILENHFFYDQIIDIKESKAKLYDFTIPENHSFIGNGFINHNSTYLRQVALTCIIAQIGCFVPAKSATIGIVDQIFTRIGASDDLARKLSTFMIEMTETAKILNYATPKSLIIIDELGRGTSTSDGQSIAMATLEKLHELKTKTLFSTHYHQLTEINLPRIKNYHLDIIENDDGTINFVRKLRPGSTDKSYGIHVAKLAGIPDEVILRAFEILEQIEEKDPFKTTVKENGNGASSGKYHEKIISEKRKELERLNSELLLTKEKLHEYNDLIQQKEKEIQDRAKFAEDTVISVRRPPQDAHRGKKTVQTSFFKPIVKTEKVLNEEVKILVDYLRKININSLTPVKAMKKMMDINEKLKKLEL